MDINGIRSFRDLTLVSLGANKILVIACDSLGGIGPKPQDNVKVPADVVGKYTVRVPLMEVLASGASPFVVVNTLSVEMEPTGIGFIKGIREEIMMAGLSNGISITGSSEENTTTCQSGLGVTVIGRAGKILSWGLGGMYGMAQNRPRGSGWHRQRGPGASEKAADRTLCAGNPACRFARGTV